MSYIQGNQLQSLVADATGLMPDLMWQTIIDGWAKKGGDPLLSMFPLGYEDADVIKKDQWQNPYGLLLVRGLGATIDYSQAPGINTEYISPGYYADATQMTEDEQTQERQEGTVSDPIEIQERLPIYMMFFATRIVARLRQTVANFCLTGQFQNINASGSSQHTYALPSYTTLSPGNNGNTGPGWAANPAQAVPINDMLYWQNYLEGLGTSSVFRGDESKIVCQQGVVVDLARTTYISEKLASKFGASFLGRGENDQGFGGQRVEGINEILLGWDLPRIVVDNDGYDPTLASAQTPVSGSFVRHMPVKSMIWKGVRPYGQMIGRLVSTRHASIEGSGKLGDYKKSLDIPDAPKLDGGFSRGLWVYAEFFPRQPARYEIEVGINFSVVPYYMQSCMAGVTYQ